MPKPSNKRRPHRTRKRLAITRSGRIAWLNTDEIADLARISKRRAQEYRRDPDAIPAAIRELLEMKALGIHPNVPDVTFLDGEIVLANGYRFTPEQLIQVTYLYQHISTLRQDNHALRARVQQLEHFLEYWRTAAGEPTAANDREL